MLEIAQEWNATVSVGVPVLGVLLLANIFFIKRLVNDIDGMKEAISKLPIQETNIKNLSKELGSLDVKIESVIRDLKDFGQVRERVAVLEYALDIKPKRGHNDLQA